MEAHDNKRSEYVKYIPAASVNFLTVKTEYGAKRYSNSFCTIESWTKCACLMRCSNSVNPRGSTKSGVRLQAQYHKILAGHDGSKKYYRQIG